MLSLLFSTSFWYDVLVVIAIIAVIATLIKYPHAKVYVFSILFALISVTGIYSIININSYYSPSGGIYGVLTGSFGDNNKLYVNEKTFELKNTTLTQVHDDTYHAKSISDDVFVVNTNEYLGVFVNGSPCTYSKIEEDYFVAYYTYNFYGKDDEILFNDTLKMYFAFYEKSTQLEVLTEGGSEAVQYWNYYFNNNDFKVTLKSVKTTYDKELSIGEGDTSNYVVVKYYLEDTEVAKQVCLKGSKIKFPTLNDDKCYKWKLEDSEDYLDTTYIVTDNLLVYGEETESAFIKKTWNGLSDFYGGDVWTDGSSYYYSYLDDQYILDKETSTWKPKTWNGFCRMVGAQIWKLGENIYYSYGNSQYVLNKTTSTWELKTWEGLTNFYGQYIWIDGENIYYSFYKDQYVLNKTTSTWQKKTWKGLSEFMGNCVWRYGNNFYFLSKEDQYILNKETSTWELKTWEGFSEFIGAAFIWTDGENICYSYDTNQYIFNEETLIWEAKTWKGLSSFYGSNIWTDGENIYYSTGKEHCELVQGKI